MAKCHFVHTACCTPVKYAPQGTFLDREPIVGDIVYWPRHEGKAVLITQRTIIFDESDKVISVMFKVDELPAEGQGAAIRAFAL
ncbi:hypothetical protein [Pseudomonas sp. LB3P31]